MNPKVIEIADAIAKGEQVSPEDFKFIKGYIYSCNKFKFWNSDDVVSAFLLDIKESYDPSFEPKQKEVWLYWRIKKAITNQSRFDKYWMLNNPVPVIVDFDWQYVPISSNHTPKELFDMNTWIEMIEVLKAIIRDWFEMDVYEKCIVWDTPVSYVAADWWKSAERWRQTKGKIIRKLKFYIENSE